MGVPAGYSELLAQLADTPAERRSLLQGYFEPTAAEREAGEKSPTQAHRAISSLVVRGFVKIILTTNFDRLLETALRDEGLEPVVISRAAAAEGAAPLAHQRCVIVKLHGDYLDDDVKNTEAELAAYDPHLNKLLDRVLDEYGLIVCGWSAEWDPALRAALQRCVSRRYSTTWTTIAAPSSHALALIAQRGAQTLQIRSADDFFTSLDAKITSVSELNSASPLSIDTAIATLKRYVAEDRYRVRLEDLILDEVRRVEKALKAFPLDGAQPTFATMATQINQMDALTETLRAIFLHGCRLANPDQGPLFVRALALLIPHRGLAGYTVLIEMAAYPVSSILYAGALGALASRNWTLLRRFLTYTYRDNGQKEIIADRLWIAKTLPGEVGNTLAGTRLHTPSSDYLANLLAPALLGLMPRPMALFEELEVWFALAYLDVVVDVASPNVGMPSGRFVWRSRFADGFDPQTLIEEAEAAGPAWPPILAGWFGGSQSRWTRVKEVFLENFERMKVRSIFG